MADATTEQLRVALSAMYGAAAAVHRADIAGMHVLLNDLYESFDEDVPALLMTMSYVTLDRLDAALALRDEARSADRAITPDEPTAVTGQDSRVLAQQLLLSATGYGVTGTPAIHAAAQRLEAVRRDDPIGAMHHARAARRLVGDVELLCGTTALLAATIDMWAAELGRTAQDATQDLCLAALTD